MPYGQRIAILQPASGVGARRGTTNLLFRRCGSQKSPPAALAVFREHRMNLMIRRQIACRYPISLRIEEQRIEGRALARAARLCCSRQSPAESPRTCQTRIAR